MVNKVVYIKSKGKGRKVEGERKMEGKKEKKGWRREGRQKKRREDGTGWGQGGEVNERKWSPSSYRIWLHPCIYRTLIVRSAS